MSMESDKHDESLNKALKAWEVTESLPPGFKGTVWRRINALDCAPARSLREGIEAWLASVLFKPAFAPAYLGVVLAAGLVGGLWAGREQSSQWEKDLATKYVQSVDPYQSPRP
jgi:hypothetical protein